MQKDIIKKINWPTTLVVLVYPALILLMVAIYASYNTLGRFELYSALTAYYISNISIGLGMHRLWSHSSYKAHPALEFVLVLTSAATFQGPTIAWVADHRMHHAYPDQKLDPHSPTKYKNKLKGFLWSHIGWLIFGDSHKKIDKVTTKRLGNNKMLVWQFRYYWQIAVAMNFILPTVIGYLIGGTAQAAFSCYLFAALGRALQQQMTFCVNSLCHFWGSRKYAQDTSVDLWWLFPFLLGENWHNYHHAFSKDYRNGHKWYHLDVHKWLIFILSKVGLASELYRTPQERINAVAKETASCVRSELIKKIANIEIGAANIAKTANLKILQAEKIALQIKNNLSAKIVSAKVASKFTQNYIEKQLMGIELSAAKIATKAKKMQNLSISNMEKLYHNLEKQFFKLRTNMDNLSHIYGIPYNTTAQ